MIDEKDNRIFESKLDNDASLTLKSLSKYKHRLKGIAVESTYNWYWLVDALMEAGHHVDLVNTAKVVQYEGLKHTNDKYDAFHLAHLMRLGILPTGHIYQKDTRGLLRGQWCELRFYVLTGFHFQPLDREQEVQSRHFHCSAMQTMELLTSLFQTACGPLGRVPVWPTTESL